MVTMTIQYYVIPIPNVSKLYHAILSIHWLRHKIYLSDISRVVWEVSREGKTEVLVTVFSIT